MEWDFIRLEKHFEQASLAASGPLRSRSEASEPLELMILQQVTKGKNNVAEIVEGMRENGVTLAITTVSGYLRSLVIKGWLDSAQPTRSPKTTYTITAPVDLSPEVSPIEMANITVLQRFLSETSLTVSQTLNTLLQILELNRENGQNIEPAELEQILEKLQQFID